MNEAKVNSYLKQEKERLEQVLDQLSASDKKLQQQAVANMTTRKEIQARVNQIDACLEEEDE